MRVLVVDTCYPAFLEAHYAARPGLAGEPYDVQWRALMDTFFGTADAYSHHLRELGHEAHEVVANCAPLQRAWAREHGLRPRPADRLRRRFDPVRVALAQAEDFRPDVVYLQDLGALPLDALARLRERSRLLAGQIASEAPPPERLRAFELLLTSFPHFVPRFRALGVASEHLRIGFDPRVLDRLGDTGPREGAVFVGALGRRQHARGNALLEAAARRAPVDFYGYAAEGWPEDSPVVRRYRGEAWGLDMYRVLARSRVALNRHIDVAEDNANNMRLYEATGVGTLLVTDAKRNLGELFEPGREVVVYEDEDDLVAKVLHYLEHEEERARIAAAGQRRTLAEHTYAHRMRELVPILERHAR